MNKIIKKTCIILFLICIFVTIGCKPKKNKKEGIKCGCKDTLSREKFIRELEKIYEKQNKQ